MAYSPCCIRPGDHICTKYPWWDDGCRFRVIALKKDGVVGIRYPWIGGESERREFKLSELEVINLTDGLWELKRNDH
jgi:hypothetical protein